MPGFLPTTHFAGPHCAARKHIAVCARCVSSIRSPFRKIDGMLAHDVAAADRLDADFLVGPLADDSFPGTIRSLSGNPVHGLGNHLPILMAVPEGASFFMR